jgi:hypothetical protein
MTPADCAILRDELDQIVAGATASAAQQIHLATCTDCRAELAWARRIDRVLAAWPTAVPPAHFASRVAAAARRETWRHEQVVDWGFNVALGVGLSAIAAGLVGVAWMVGSTAAVDGAPQAALNTVGALLATARAQAPVVATALLLLVTTGGAWWWAEERGRW